MRLPFRIRVPPTRGWKKYARTLSDFHSAEHGHIIETVAWFRRLATSLLQGRNNQHLARVDEVRILEHRLVGFKDDRVFPGIAINLLGDL